MARGKNSAFLTYTFLMNFTGYYSRFTSSADIYQYLSAKCRHFALRNHTVVKKWHFLSYSALIMLHSRNHEPTSVNISVLRLYLSRLTSSSVSHIWNEDAYRPLLHRSLHSSASFFCLYFRAPHQPAYLFICVYFVRASRQSLSTTRRAMLLFRFHDCSAYQHVLLLPPSWSLVPRPLSLSHLFD